MSDAMYAVYGLDLASPSEHVGTITDFFAQSSASLHGVWLDPDSPRSLYLLIGNVDEPHAITNATTALTGGTLLDLNIDPLELDALGIYSDPARTFLAGNDLGALMAAAPPRRYECPGCFVDLAVQKHLPDCPVLRHLSP